MADLVEAVNELAAAVRRLGAQQANIDSYLHRIAELNQLSFIMDQRVYLTTKVRSGEAYIDKGAYYIPLAPGATVAITFVNPQGYVWISHEERGEVSQDGVIEVTMFRDDYLIPFLYLPRVGDRIFGISWIEALPYESTIKEQGTIIYTNWDAAPQWVIGAFMGTYLRKDVWEKESKLIDTMAKKYFLEVTP